jgi:MFS family permease
MDFVSPSITIYMLLCGFVPSVWGTLVDSCGRRPVFLSTLIVHLLTSPGLTLSNNLASLMVFHGIQAIGGLSTIAIGAGVIGSIASAGERWLHGIIQWLPYVWASN